MRGAHRHQAMHLRRHQCILGHLVQRQLLHNVGSHLCRGQAGLFHRRRRPRDHEQGPAAPAGDHTTSRGSQCGPLSKPRGSAGQAQYNDPERDDERHRSRYERVRLGNEKREMETEPAILGSRTISPRPFACRSQAYHQKKRAGDKETTRAKPNYLA